MITQSVHIKNFKSIRDLKFLPRKINLFIGDPNAGKSNIIESLGLLSSSIFSSPQTLKKVIRFENIGNLFFDFNISSPISIKTGESSFVLRFDSGSFNVFIQKKEEKVEFKLGINGEILSRPLFIKESVFKPYVFTRLDNFLANYDPALSSPFGENIPGLLLSNSYLKGLVSGFLRDRQFRITLNPVENKVAVSKEVNEEIYTYPYSTISETFQRIIFMMLAIESNKNSVLLFDEPEANTFPYYTKYIAEQIAIDDSNQYFLSTHNPYFLSAIVEKAKIEEVAVFITYMDEQYQTQLKRIEDDKMGQILDLSSDVFFNLDKFFHE